MYTLPKFFCPNFKTKLVRLGKSNDGGYCIPEKSLETTEILFSFGLDDDWSFEKDFKKRSKAKIICFDNSVKIRFWIKRLLKDLIYFNFKRNFYEQFSRFYTFFKYIKFFNQKDTYHIKKHLISNNIILTEQTDKNFISFQNILKSWGNNNFFLKIDIEGNEYKILNDIIKNQENINGLVIEFHECDLMSVQIEDFIKKLNLDLVHIHVNNFCSITKDNFPTVLELTFSPKKFNSKRNIDELNFPNKEIDQPNNKMEKDISVNFK